MYEILDRPGAKPFCACGHSEGIHPVVRHGHRPETTDRCTVVGCSCRGFREGRRSLEARGAHPEKWRASDWLWATVLAGVVVTALLMIIAVTGG